MQTVIKIEGMSCQNCVRHATTALLAVEGVDEVEVTLTPGQAVVTHAEGLTPDLLMAAIEEEGYTPSL